MQKNRVLTGPGFSSDIQRTASIVPTLLTRSLFSADQITAESNPFSLPSDEEVFRMRETEKARKEEVSRV